MCKKDVPYLCLQFVPQVWAYNIFFQKIQAELFNGRKQYNYCDNHQSVTKNEKIKVLLNTYLQYLAKGAFLNWG